MSSLITSKFGPDGTIAFVIQTLDTQTLKVQTVGGDIDRSVVTYPFAKTLRVSALTWFNNDTLVVRFQGSNQIQLINTHSGDVGLVTKTTYPVSALTTGKSKLYALDTQNTLFEYQLSAGLDSAKLINHWSVDAKDVCQLYDYSERYLLLFSTAAHLFDKKSGSIVSTLGLYLSSVKCVVRNGEKVAVSAEGDRFINILEVGNGTIESEKRLLVTESPVLQLTWKSMDEISLESIAALTEEGKVEVFNDPLASTGTQKKIRAAVQSKQSTCKVELDRDNNVLALANVLLTERNLDLAWLEESSYLAFDYIPWWVRPSEGTYDYELKDDLKLVKQRPRSGLQRAADLKGNDLASANHYNEGNAVVSSGANYRDLDTDDEDDFGHLVEKYVAPDVKKHKAGKLQAGSLTIVLSQALKSNDEALFETVINNNRDEAVISRTVEKLDTAYVLALLDRIAGRLGRGAGAKNRQLQQHLETWVRYVLIYHGASLINMPHLSADLNLLSQSLRLRSNNLDRLLQLRASLGMITSLIEVKRDLGDLDRVQKEQEDGEDDVEYIEEVDDAGLMDTSESDDDDGSDDDEDDDEMSE